MLESWDAVRLERINAQGRTKPLIIECVGPDGATATSPRREFLVKALGLPEIRAQSLFCEITGNWLARACGVNTPSPALVNLSPAFVSSVNYVLAQDKLKLQTGIGVGCEYIAKGFTGFSPLMALRAEEVPQAALIYGFDALFQNPDRRVTNPNLGFLGEKLIAFDFESTFSFLLPILGAVAEPWEVSRNGIGLSHILARKLRPHEVDWQPLINAVAACDTRQLAALADELPAHWRGYMPTVQAHLTNLQSNLHRLAFELQRSLP